MVIKETRTFENPNHHFVESEGTQQSLLGPVALSLDQCSFKPCYLNDAFSQPRDPHGALKTWVRSQGEGRWTAALSRSITERH